jgi:hypothetical protein
MVDFGMKPMPPKVIGKRFVYGLKVLQGYQRTLYPKGVQTFKRGRSQKKQGNL